MCKKSDPNYRHTPLFFFFTFRHVALHTSNILLVFYVIDQRKALHNFEAEGKLYFFFHMSH